MMIVCPNRFRLAIDYLSAFTKPETPVVFMPRGNKVQVSVLTDELYAEYWLQTDQPLAQQFSVQMRSLPAIAVEAREEEISVELASACKIVAGRSEWRILYCDVPDKPRPEVHVRESIVWDGSFGSILRMCAIAVRDKEDRSCMDCVSIEQTTRSQAIVATDGSFMVAHLVETPSEEPGLMTESKVLIEGRNIARVARTCESGAKVLIDIGAKQYSVHCGHRRAIFPIRDGVFPKWRPLYKEAKRKTVGRSKHPGSAHLPSRRMRVAMRQTGRVDGPIRLTTNSAGLRLQSRNELGESDVVVDAEWGGQFGPVNLSSKYLANIAKTWPFDDINLGFSSSREPVVCTSPESPSSMAIIMPHA